MIDILKKESFKEYCDDAASRDIDLKTILLRYGYPPWWTRSTGFSTLIHIILEQQISLASAKAALNKLKEKIGTISPKKILAMSDDDFKSCYFSRQKIIYARHLAEAVVSKKLDLKKLDALPEDMIRQKLKAIKGIGDWTVDVYLLMALHRSDIFPVGDQALAISIKHVKRMDTFGSKPEIMKLSESWKPYRSIAAILLWHAYLNKKKNGEIWK